LNKERFKECEIVVYFIINKEIMKKLETLMQIEKIINDLHEQRKQSLNMTIDNMLIGNAFIKV
jgi:hypothetical protein